MALSTSNLLIGGVGFADTGAYSVIVSNWAGVVTSAVAVLDVTLVQNAAFETGDFTGWTLSGDASNSFVYDGAVSGITPDLGNYAAVLTTSGSIGYLSQTLSTTPELGYLLSYWFYSPSTNSGLLLVSWNGTTLLDTTNLEANDWTKMQFLVLPTGSNTVLQFGFQVDDGFFGLDDISVVPAPLEIDSVCLSGGNLVLNASNGQSGRTYYVRTSTNLDLPLNEWTFVATNNLTVSGNFTITVINRVSPTDPQRFYILQTQ